MRYVRPELFEADGEATAAPSLLPAVVESTPPRPIVGYWKGASGRIYPTTVYRRPAPRAKAPDTWDSLFQAAMVKMRAETEMYRLMGLFTPGRKRRQPSDEELMIAAVNSEH